MAFGSPHPGLENIQMRETSWVHSTCNTHGRENKSFIKNIVIGFHGFFISLYLCHISYRKNHRPIRPDLIQSAISFPE